MKDLIKNLKNRITYYKYRDILLPNKAYKNKYAGKRCFIIGNGPSLKKHNLELLKDEYTFTVNSMSSTKEFDVIKPKFHVVVDPTRFDEKNTLFLEEMERFVKKKDLPVCIFPARFRNYVEKHALDKQLKIIYVYAENNTKSIKNIDLTSRIPYYQNVINVALSSALYMGFEEIYLIGCDMTGFISIWDEDDNIDYGGHFYEKENLQEKKFLDKLHRERTNEYMLKAYGYVFELFRLTNDYALSKGVNIFNATKGGALDVFPRIKYEDLFNEKTD